MKETARILKLFEDFYGGTSFIEVNINGVLEQITSKQAAEKVLPGKNSIWEIVNHIIGWRLNVLQRVRGKKMPPPDNNYFASITDTSETSWKKTLEQLDSSQTYWVNYIRTMKEDDLNNIYDGGNRMTYYEHILGIIQHDAYHLGQIVLLTKLF